jgi:hypothetical protein
VVSTALQDSTAQQPAASDGLAKAAVEQSATGQHSSQQQMME